jgi:hypothetical protein
LRAVSRCLQARLQGRHLRALLLKLLRQLPHLRVPGSRQRRRLLCCVLLQRLQHFAVPLCRRLQACVSGRCRRCCRVGRVLVLLLQALAQVAQRRRMRCLQRLAVRCGVLHGGRQLGLRIRQPLQHGLGLLRLLLLRARQLLLGRLQLHCQLLPGVARRCQLLLKRRQRLRVCCGLRGARLLQRGELVLGARQHLAQLRHLRCVNSVLGCHRLGRCLCGSQRGSLCLQLGLQGAHLLAGCRSLRARRVPVRRQLMPGCCQLVCGGRGVCLCVGKLLRLLPQLLSCRVQLCLQGCRLRRCRLQLLRRCLPGLLGPGGLCLCMCGRLCLSGGQLFSALGHLSSQVCDTRLQLVLRRRRRSQLPLQLMLMRVSCGRVSLRRIQLLLQLRRRLRCAGCVGRALLLARLAQRLHVRRKLARALQLLLQAHGGLRMRRGLARWPAAGGVGCV